MLAFPNPDDDGVDVAPSRGESVTELASASVALARALHTRRTWPFTWSSLRNSEAALLNSFYAGAYGPGPYALVHAATTDNSSLDTSLCGSRRGVLTGWVPNGGGTAVYDSTVAPFATPGGVVRWSGAGSSSVLSVGSLVGGVVFADTAKAPPYISAEQVTVSIYAKTASGTATIKSSARGRTITGAALNGVDSSGVAVTSAGSTRVTVTATAAALGAAVFVIPIIFCTTASAPDILCLPVPQLEYGSAVSTWAPGTGVPRVVIAAGAQSIPVVGQDTWQLTLREI